MPHSSAAFKSDWLLEVVLMTAALSKESTALCDFGNFVLHGAEERVVDEDVGQGRDVMGEGEGGKSEC